MEDTRNGHILVVKDPKEGLHVLDTRVPNQDGVYRLACSRQSLWLNLLAFLREALEEIGGPEKERRMNPKVNLRYLIR